VIVLRATQQLELFFGFLIDYFIKDVPCTYLNYANSYLHILLQTTEFEATTYESEV